MTMTTQTSNKHKQNNITKIHGRWAQKQTPTNHLLQHNFYSFWLIMRTLFVILFCAALPYHSTLGFTEEERKKKKMKHSRLCDWTNIYCRYVLGVNVHFLVHGTHNNPTKKRKREMKRWEQAIKGDERRKKREIVFSIYIYIMGHTDHSCHTKVLPRCNFMN